MHCFTAPGLRLSGMGDGGQEQSEPKAPGLPSLPRHCAVPGTPTVSGTRQAPTPVWGLLIQVWCGLARWARKRLSRKVPGSISSNTMRQSRAVNRKQTNKQSPLQPCAFILAMFKMGTESSKKSERQLATQQSAWRCEAEKARRVVC